MNQPQSPMTNAPGKIKHWLLITLIIAAVGAVGYFGWQYWNQKKLDYSYGNDALSTPSTSATSNKSTTTTLAPIETNVSDLMTNPEKYLNKNISVTSVLKQNGEYFGNNLLYFYFENNNDRIKVTTNIPLEFPPPGPGMKNPGKVMSNYVNKTVSVTGIFKKETWLVESKPVETGFFTIDTDTIAIINE